MRRSANEAGPQKGGNMSANMNAATAPYGAGYATSANATLLLLARIFMAALFLVAGIRKVLGYAATVGYLTKLGFPAAEVFAVIAIVIEIGAGLMLVFGWRTRWAAWALIVFVVIATAMAHRFWQFEPAQQVNQLNHFLKNFAVICGLLFGAAFGPGRIAIDMS
jgi:putative oxidoreductase